MSQLKNEDRQFTVTDEDGKETLCTILFTFHSDEFNKDYVVFYPSEQEDNDEIELSAASFVEGPDGIGELQDIETEEEWEMIENALDHFEEDFDEECDDDECEHCHHHDEDEE